MQVFGRLVLLLCAAAVLWPVPCAHAVTPPTLDQVLKGAEELRDSDLDELLNRQLDKVEREERTRNSTPQPAQTAADPRDATLDELLNRQLDKYQQDGQAGTATPQQTPAGKEITVGQHASAETGKLPVPDGKSATVAQEQDDNVQSQNDLTEDDVTAAYRKVISTARKEVGSPVQRSGGTLFVIVVLGSALALIMLCVNIARFAAYRISCAINQSDWGRPLTHTDVRYSWYYQDAINRFPPSRQSHRR